MESYMWSIVDRNVTWHNCIWSSELSHCINTGFVLQGVFLGEGDESGWLLQSNQINQSVISSFEGAMSGGFYFQVTDGLNFAPQQIFSIIAQALILSLEVNRGLSIFPGKSLSWASFFEFWVFSCLFRKFYLYSTIFYYRTILIIFIKSRKDLPETNLGLSATVLSLICLPQKTVC